MSTKKIENNGVVIKELNMALECDELANEERLKCVSEDRRVSRKAEGNEVLKCGRETLEKYVSKLMKERDRNNNCKEYLQHENGEQWELTCVETRNDFKCCTPSVIKCIAGFHVHSNKIRKTHRCNTTTVCPVRLENKNWDHAIKCHKNEDIREEGEKHLRKKIGRMEQCKKADEEEKLIVKELLKDTNKSFNN